MRMHTAVGKLFTCLAAMLLMALPGTPVFADEILPTMNMSDDMAEAAPPTIAEFEHYGPKTLDSSREAISQASTHIATPEQALRAQDATMAVGMDARSDVKTSGPTTSTGLTCTGDSLMEGMVIVLGGVVIVAFSLLLYHFRKE